MSSWQWLEYSLMIMLAMPASTSTETRAYDMEIPLLSHSVCVMRVTGV